MHGTWKALFIRSLFMDTYTYGSLFYLRHVVYYIKWPLVWKKKEKLEYSTSFMWIWYQMFSKAFLKKSWFHALSKPITIRCSIYNKVWYTSEYSVDGNCKVNTWWSSSSWNKPKAIHSWKITRGHKKSIPSQFFISILLQLLVWNYL